MARLVLTKEIQEYIRVRYESTQNITHIADEVMKKFNLQTKAETFRRRVGTFLAKSNIKKQTSEIKRLFFDIETSYYLVPTFQFWKVNINPDNILREKKIICIAYKWQYEDKVHVLKWDENQDDTKLIKDFIQVIKDADEIVAHNCVEVNTPVLTSDFRWVKAGDLKEGDTLGGFEEKTPPNTTCRNKDGKWNGNGYRKLKEAKVTDFSKKMAECIKVTFDNGDEVTTTKDHFWLSLGIKDRNQRWRSSQELVVGNRVMKYFNPWERDNTYNGGWISGFISGEGTLKMGGEAGLSIDFCQRAGVTWDKALRICDELGLELCKKRKPKTGGLGKGDTLYTGINGGKFKTMEVIGKYEIDRFIHKIDWNNLGFLKGKNLEVATVVKIEEVGMKEVAVFSTSSKTFFGAGYPMHNCDKFDIKELRTRAILTGNLMFPIYRTLDTLKKSRQYFRFPSNKLDYLGKVLNVGRKLDHEGMKLWIDICEHKNKASLKRMIDYCVQDVAVLEDVYFAISPYIYHNTNMAVLKGGEKWHCPECASKNVQLSHTDATAMGYIKRHMKCNSCRKFYKISNRTYLKMLEFTLLKSKDANT